MREGAKLHTVTRVYKFDDPTGEIYQKLRKGASIASLGVEPKDFVVKEGNVFLDEGLNFIWNAVTGATGLTYFNSSNSYIGVGDGTTAADHTQTGLQGTNKYYKLVDSGYPTVSGNTATFRATFGGTEANFAWNEWTVANGSSDTAVNLNRKVESLGTKPSGATWVLEVQLSIS
jgi:hypothetical protein